MTRLLGVLAAAAVWWAPLPLSPEGHRLAGILALVSCYWMTEAIPLPAAALLGMALAVAAGIADARTVFAPFADPIMFLMLGSFLLANAMSAHGLDRTIAAKLVALPGVRRSPWRLLVVMGVLTAAISCWITNTATTAMLLPVVLGIVNRTKGDSRAVRRFGAALVLLVAYGSTAGGLGTPVGTTPNLIGLGFLRDQAGVTVSFATWMSFGMTVAALQMLSLFLVFRLYLGDPDAVTVDRSGSGRTGPLTPGQRWVGGGFLAAVVLWVVPDVGVQLAGPESSFAVLKRMFPESAVPLLVIGALFLVRSRGKPLIGWEVASSVDWGTMVLFGGGLSLGALAFRSGLAEALGRGVVGATGVTEVWALTAVLGLAAVFMSEFTSNAATASMLVPVAIATAQAAGVPPAPPALAVTIASSLGCMMPVSTPPNALAYGTGKVPFRTMLMLGLAFDILGAIAVWLVLRIACPLLGLAG